MRWLGYCLATLVVLACLPAMARAPLNTVSAAEAREQMVAKEIVAAGIKDPRVIESMRMTPRHEFVNVKDRPYAYLDMALPIGEAQTISPPFIVAYMTEQLEPKATDKVLEIGTGSGFQSAVLSPLVKEVYSIEIKEPLGRQAARVLKRLGYANVFTKIGDGYQGWPDKAPFDKVIVTCSPENVPQALVDQLREGGRLVIPLGERYQQTLYLYRKENGKLVREALRPTLFVPMTGTAEELRKLQPDPLKPTLINGSFEETATEDGNVIPKGWYYVRQAELVSDRLAPDGEHFLRFTNTTPGRNSQALQAFAVDGRKIPALSVSLRMRAKSLGPGQSPLQMPMLMFVFYDDKQNMIGERGVGPWRGTFDWQTEQAVIRVPPKAVYTIARIGLLGGVGELDVDALRVSAKRGD